MSYLDHLVYSFTAQHVVLTPNDKSERSCISCKRINIRPQTLIAGVPWLTWWWWSWSGGFALTFFEWCIGSSCSCSSSFSWHSSGTFPFIPCCHSHLRSAAPGSIPLAGHRLDHDYVSALVSFSPPFRHVLAAPPVVLPVVLRLDDNKHAWSVPHRCQRTASAE